MMSGGVEVLEQDSFLEIARRWEADDATFARSLRSGASPARALAALGVRLCMRERYEDSIDVLGAAASLLPDDLPILNDLAVVLERAGRTDEAIGGVERSLALSHAQPDSWIFLGNLKKKQGDLAGAMAAYETAVSLEAVSPLAWQSLGLIRKERREYKQAIECFINCIRQIHATAPILAILGQLFYSTGQFGKSRDAYAAAVEMDEHNPTDDR